MDPMWQAIFFGLAELAFLIGCIVSYVTTPPPNRWGGFNWVSLGLLFAFFVPFINALKAS